jgi:hypothetical protein
MIPPAYVAWLAGTTAPFVVPARQATSRYKAFLGSSNVYKFGLKLLQSSENTRKKKKD